MRFVSGVQYVLVYLLLRVSDDCRSSGNMSAALILRPRTKLHTYADELESFLHTLTYTLTRYSKSSYDPRQLCEYIVFISTEATEHQRAHGQTYSSGGRNKSVIFDTGIFPLTWNSTAAIISLLVHGVQFWPAKLHLAYVKMQFCVII